MKRWRSTLISGVSVLSMATFLTAIDAAAVQLPELNGSWRGSGTDRATPFESAQQTICRATIHADQANLDQEMVCEGKEGLHKSIHLAVHVNGGAVSGTLTQTSTTRGSGPATLRGSVAGTRTENAANLQVHFGGLIPTVTVDLRMNSKSSYSIQASTFAATLMDVSFNRGSRR
jgi:hypothetical protein